MNLKCVNKIITRWWHILTIYSSKISALKLNDTEQAQHKKFSSSHQVLFSFLNIVLDGCNESSLYSKDVWVCKVWLITLTLSAGGLVQAAGPRPSLLTDLSPRFFGWSLYGRFIPLLWRKRWSQGSQLYYGYFFILIRIWITYMSVTRIHLVVQQLSNIDYHFDFS